MKTILCKITKDDCTSIVGVVYSENGVTSYDVNPHFKTSEYSNVKFGVNGRMNRTTKERIPVVRLADWDPIRLKIGCTTCEMDTLIRSLKR